MCAPLVHCDDARGTDPGLKCVRQRSSNHAKQLHQGCIHRCLQVSRLEGSSGRAHTAAAKKGTAGWRCAQSRGAGSGSWQGLNTAAAGLLFADQVVSSALGSLAEVCEASRLQMDLHLAAHTPDRAQVPKFCSIDQSRVSRIPLHGSSSAHSAAVLAAPAGMAHLMQAVLSSCMLGFCFCIRLTDQ